MNIKCILVSHLSDFHLLVSTTGFINLSDLFAVVQLSAVMVAPRASSLLLPPLTTRAVHMCFPDLTSVPGKTVRFLV